MRSWQHRSTPSAARCRWKKVDLPEPGRPTATATRPFASSSSRAARRRRRRGGRRRQYAPPGMRRGVLERASRERLLEPRLRHERRARVDLPRPVDVVGHDDDFRGGVDRDAARLGRPDLPLANISTDDRDARPGEALQRGRGRCLLLFRHRDASRASHRAAQPRVSSWRAVVRVGARAAICTVCTVALCERCARSGSAHKSCRARSALPLYELRVSHAVLGSSAPAESFCRLPT